MVPGILERVRQACGERGLDVVVGMSPDNACYLAGFMVPSHPRNRHRRVAAVLDGARLDLLTVRVEESFARAAKGRVDGFLSYDEFGEPPMSVLARHLERRGLGKATIGLEMDFIPAGDLEQLEQCLPAARFRDAHGLFQACRRIKSADEIQHLQEAARIADEAYRASLPLMRIGMAENELASILVAQAMAAGAESARLAALASGNRSVHINAGPTRRVLAAGEIIRVDLIVQCDGYFGDVARTLVAGAPEPQHRKAWAALVESRDRVLEFIRPGRTAGEVFQAYEASLAAHGLEPWLGFIGHGIGLSVHEAPSLPRNGANVIEEGDVLCIEPTIQVGEAFGLHVEEELEVGRDGVRLLTDVDLNRDLLVVGTA